MSKKIVLVQLSLALMALAVAGCASSGSGGGIETRAYIADKDRVDQKMEGGNFGYVTGTPKQPDLSKMSKSRKVYVLEVTKNPDVTVDELRKGAPPVTPVTINVPERDDRGSVAPSSDYDERPVYHSDSDASSNAGAVESGASTEATTPSEYVIQKGDTLQKISKKVYGGYSKWNRIYEANKDIIPNPNKIKVGLTIRIP